MSDQLSQVNLDLRTFERKNSSSGRFVRYCKGRVKNALSRQLAVLIGSLVLAFLVGWRTGLATLVIAGIGEAIDLGLLWRLARQRDVRVATPRNVSLTTVTSGIHALSIAICVSIAWFQGGPDARFFAMAFLTGTMVDAGIITRLHRPAIYVKQAIYLMTAAMLFGSDFVSGNWMNKEFAFDAFGAILFACMLWVLLSFVNRQDGRRVAFEHELLKEKHRTDRINRALAENENKARQLALVAQHANDSVIISNPEGKIIWVNETFTKITGYSMQEALGCIPGDILNGPETDKKTIAKIVAAAKSNKPVRVEIENVTKSGKKVWMETSLMPILDKAGELSITIGVERDITAAKAKEFELSQAKLDAEDAANAKSNFLATMSHEIRTPMNGIIGMADLLRQSELDENQREFVDTIVGSGESLLQIINDIIDFSKLDAGKMGIESNPFNLTETLTAVINLLAPIATEKGIDLQFDVEGDIPQTLLGDPGRIRQVAVNLIGNAIKFTQSGGVIVQLSGEENSDGYHVRVKITDTGIGIAPDKVGKIFENFSQAEQQTSRKFGGTGLGLSIARLLARKMRGDITVRSVLNVGSTFEFTCCLDPANSEAHLVPDTPKFTEDSTQYLNGLRVLVAEDNRTNRLLIEKMLVNIGVELEFAEDGDVAVDMFKTMAPDVVFMDVSMPHKDGLEATREIRRWEKASNQKPCPIVALTANAFEEDRKRCAAAGMDDFLTKPIKKAVLLDVLAIHAKSSKGSQTSAADLVSELDQNQQIETVGDGD